jgi:hypothetical protein
MDRQKSSSTVSVLLSVWTLVRRSTAVGVIGRMVAQSNCTCLQGRPEEGKVDVYHGSLLYSTYLGS